VVASLFVLAACAGPRLDPVRALPVDVDAIAVLRPAGDLADRTTALFQRLPEAVGAADLLRSVTGFDLRSAEATRQQGLDPQRSLAIAWWKGALVVAIPVDDRDIASRRLGLRMARLGFVEETTGETQIRRFHDLRDKGRGALLRVDKDVALACVGPTKSCAGLQTLAPAAAGGGAGDLAVAAAVEAGLADGDLSVWVGNDLLMALAKRQFGLVPPGGAAGILLRAAIGDLRLVASLDQGLQVRAVFGPNGDPLACPSAPATLQSGVLARADVDLGSLPDGLMNGLLDACGPACRADGLGDTSAILKAWDGRATVALLVASDPAAGPVTGVRAFLRRAVAVAGAGLRPSNGASVGLSAAALLASRLGVSTLPWADSDLEGLAGVAQDGLEVAAATRGDILVGAAGRGAEAAGRNLALGRLAGLAGVPPVLASGKLVRVAVDPSGWVEALGGLGIEFVRHLASAVRIVGVEASLADGRLTVDAIIRLR
jgi:hypothetical protein